MITISARNISVDGRISLPASKSESNRALIIQALNPGIELHNLSSARDTQTMIRLLKTEAHVLDVIDAGTTMRFLTAFCAIAGRSHLITGTPRMCQRPIGPLVSALRSLGAGIDYWKQEGYPPLHIRTFKNQMQGGTLSMPGNISSQFISAILLIAPYVDQGLTLTLTDEVSSKPYLDMTMALMGHFGAEVAWISDQSIRVEPGPYQNTSYTIESDWSGASYWYSLVALSQGGTLFLEGLRTDSLQGDRAIVEMMQAFGVETTFETGGARLAKTTTSLPESLEIDCLKTPDLAQTLAVIAGAAGVKLTLTGLHTLRVKETDRIDAMVRELRKCNLEVTGGPDFLTVAGTFSPSRETIRTYDDHRMAMAFAPLALRQPSLSFDEEEVVNKSYPEFWQHLEQIGARIFR